MSVYIVIALFALKHFLASYPFQCSYTVKGLQQDPGWLVPMLARSSVFGVLTAALVAGYWMYAGHPINWVLLAAVSLGDMASHIVIDRIKVSGDMLGGFQVASPQEISQMKIDYQSKDPAVVKAAQAESDSNKYFWWVDGACHLAYGLVGIYIVSLIY
jgi:hypothetical protein